MGILYEVVAVTGTYTDKDGKEKKRYTKLGVVMDTKNGPMLKLESVPVGWDGWAYMNEPQAKDERPKAKPADTDEIPF